MTHSAPRCFGSESEACAFPETMQVSKPRSSPRESRLRSASGSSRHSSTSANLQAEGASSLYFLAAWMHQVRRRLDALNAQVPFRPFQPLDWASGCRGTHPSPSTGWRPKQGSSDMCPRSADLSEVVWPRARAINRSPHKKQSIFVSPSKTEGDSGGACTAQAPGFLAPFKIS